MSNWIKERADAVRIAEKEQKEELERKAGAARDLKRQLDPFWQELVDVLSRCVKQFNFEFPETNRKIDEFEKPSSDTVMIRRTAYPAVSVKAQLNNAGTTVQYSISRIQRKGVNAAEKQASFSYTVTNGKIAYSDPALGSHEDVAKMLLDAFFEF